MLGMILVKEQVPQQLDGSFQQVHLQHFDIYQLFAMDGSKYYGENRYLSSIFHKQERQSRPVQMQQTNPPFHFLKREMSEDEKKQLIQKKIFDNPSLYISTHVKCQICNRYIEIQLANHHSRIHFDQEERISRILMKNNNVKSVDLHF